MAPHTVTLQLPPQLYEQLARRAADAHHSVAAEILEVVAASVPDAEDLSSELTEAIAGLSVLDDDALWQAARSRMPGDLAARLEELHWKQQATGLEEKEAGEVSQLIALYERFMLVRAEAARLLHERGHEVSLAQLGE